ncbi:hypothetical protein ES703_24490 [subsurface metagenome]
MRILLFLLAIALLLPYCLFAQTVLWSYHATGSFWVHIRSIKNIEDVNGDNHQDVIAVSENDTLYCLSGINGNPIWKFAADPCYLERGLISVPDLDGDSIPDVVLGTIWGTRSVFAISGATGDTIWYYDTHEYGSGGWVYEVAPMSDIDGDNVIDILASTGSVPDRAYLFSGATGTKIWEPYIGAAVFGIREIGDLNGDSIPDVAIGTGDGNTQVITLNGINGNQIWDENLSGAGWTVITIGDLNGDTVNDVISGNMAGEIIAFSGVNGATIWTKNIGGTVVDLNILPDVNGNGFDELLPSGTTMYNFYCIDGLTDSTLWSTPAADQIFASVSVPDITGDAIGDVVGGTGYNTNVFYALDGATGDVIWQKSMSGCIESCWWIEDIDGNGYPDILVGTRDGWIYALADGNVGIEEMFTEVPSPFIHSSVQPNPSSGRVTIKYSLPSKTRVVIDIYSAAGEKIVNLSDRVETTGNKTIEWNGRDKRGHKAPAGIYFYRIQLGDYSKTEKLMLVH